MFEKEQKNVSTSEKEQKNVIWLGSTTKQKFPFFFFFFFFGGGGGGGHVHLKKKYS